MCWKIRGGYRKIYAFELEKNFYQQLITNVEKEGLENIDAYNIGIAETCNEQGSMICLDTMFLEKEITLVKMDIEGYEWGRYMADWKQFKNGSQRWQSVYIIVWKIYGGYRDWSSK